MGIGLWIVPASRWSKSPITSWDNHITEKVWEANFQDAPLIDEEDNRTSQTSEIQNLKVVCSKRKR